MGKIKDQKKHRKAEALKQRRKNKEGGKHGAQAQDKDLARRVRELEAQNDEYRDTLNDLYDTMRQIAGVTDGSRWKEAKEANRLASEALR